MGRGKPKLSALHSFASSFCTGSSEEDTRIRTAGSYRVVYVNEPDRHEEEGFRYPLNMVSTTKYSLVTIVPKSLYEQFRRVANIYFLVSGVLSATAVAPYTAVSPLAILPLCISILWTMAKEGFEDWKRKKQVSWFLALMFSEFYYNFFLITQRN
jgi:phospholipid-translocating ATPase